MGLTLGGMIAAALAAWFAGRAHLKATQLAALDKALKQPAGSLEAKANAATEQAAAAAGQAAGAAVDKKLGGSANGNGQ